VAPAAAAAPRSGGPALAPAAVPEAGLSAYATFARVVEAIRERRDAKLLFEVETCLRLVRYAPGRIEFQPTDDAPPDLAARLAQRLQAWTGVRWGVSVTGTGGGPTLAEQAAAERAAEAAEAARHPMVAAVLAAFPQARIVETRDLAQAAAEAALAPAEAEDEDWDPFEDG
jgi:DNA polymerase-3 subunit gamma/tau